MNYCLKATLLSALIFPGLGQMLLKYYRTGISLAVVAFICIVTVVSQAVSKTMRIAEQLQQQGKTLDATQIAETARQLSQQYDSSLINLAMAGLVLCWLIGVIHAYIAGRARDAAEQAGDQPE